MKINFKEVDWIALGSALMIISATTVVAVWAYNYKYRECTSNPLTYGAKWVEDAFGYEVHGTITIFTDDPNLKAPTITFNNREIVIGDENNFIFDPRLLNLSGNNN